MPTKKQIKSTGATFTPSQLADFLSDRILKYTTDEDALILDPACGEGALLLSLGEKLTARSVTVNLIGFDSNLDYLTTAKTSIHEKGWKNASLKNEDFLEAVVLPNSAQANTGSIQTDLFSEPAKCGGVGKNIKADIIIANPPYVRTQVLGSDKAQLLAKKFDLKGRVDLYYPFLISMTESLKEGGILGVITSNRYLYTKSGTSIRKYLSENYEILELIDLGDTKLFAAAVLPAILIAKKKAKAVDSNPLFIKVYEASKEYVGDTECVSTIYEALNSHTANYFKLGSKSYKVTKGVLKYEVGSEEAWGMLTDEELNWITKIQKASPCTVGDIFKVKVGVKTTADNVFISDSWDSLGKEKPEASLLKGLLSQENISRWTAVENSALQMLYPHYSEGGKKYTVDIEDYPLAMKYFRSHEVQLKGRQYVIDAGRKWYEIWVPQKPEVWKLPKLVFPDISLEPRFYFDKSGKIVNGNCYWIAAKNKVEEEHLLLIQGIANSKLMTKYHDLVFNNKLYSGRRRYITQYVEKYPLPSLSSPVASEIAQLANELNNSFDQSDISILEYKLEQKVAQAYGVEPVYELI